MSNSAFYRDTWAEVDLDCIFHNVEQMKAHLGEETEIIAVVKANGYGHSAVHVAKTALEAGATILAVALLDEAILLRKAGLKVPILVLGWIRPNDVNVAVEYNVMLTAFQLDWFQEASRVLRRDAQLKFHLKLDTGMGRIGLKTKEEVDSIFNFINQDPRIVCSGVYTHFATADECDNEYFYKQYKTFVEMLSWVKRNGVEPDIIHSGNSATGLRFPEKTFNAVRFGISMYGLSPSEEIKGELPFELKEAFTLHSRIVHIKQVKAGERISYGGTYEAKGDEWIGTLPIGYADGWIRKLRAAEVLVEGQRCPIVGRICMDQLMIRLPNRVPIGTKATLIGKQDDNEIPVDEIAKTLETINYEIPCMISYRVPRMIFRKKRIIEVEHYFRND